MTYLIKLLPILLLIFSSIFAQDNKWHYSIDGNFIITLNTFSDNWTGSNAGSIIWVSKLNGVWKRQLTQRVLSENTLKLAFGQTRLQDKKTKKWSSPEKSSDNIDFLTILKFKFGGFTDPYSSLRITSQFLDNHTDSSLAYLNPIELSESFGLTRDIIRNKNILWHARLGCALRQNIDFNKWHPSDSLRRSWTSTEIINDGGAEIYSEFQFRKDNYLKVFTKLRLYQAFLSTQALKTSPNDNWRHPDINLESTVSFNVTKNILFNYCINVVYDKEIDISPRIKHSMGAGIGINFSSKPRKK